LTGPPTTEHDRDRHAAPLEAPWAASLEAAKGRRVPDLGGGARSLPLGRPERLQMSISFRRIAITPVNSWFGTDGDPFNPQRDLLPWAETKIWGAVLERMREAEFAPWAMQGRSGPPLGPQATPQLAPWLTGPKPCTGSRAALASIFRTEASTGHRLSPGPLAIEPFLRAAALGPWSGRVAVPTTCHSPWSEDPRIPSGRCRVVSVVGLPALKHPATQLRTGPVTRLHVNPSGSGRAGGGGGDRTAQTGCSAGDQGCSPAGAIHHPRILLAFGPVTPFPKAGQRLRPGGPQSDEVAAQRDSAAGHISQFRSAIPPASWSSTDYYWGD